MLIIGSVISCKKENQDTAESRQATDSAATVSAAPAAIKAVSPKQASEILGKKNDTLYVTNFFATWCGPCVREIPHFKNKIRELEGKPVKITFVSMDSKQDWEAKVPAFADEQGIRNHTILLDGQELDGTFFSSNFKEWTGSAIPFTFMRKGDRTDETLGMISEEQLTSKINSFLK